MAVRGRTISFLLMVGTVHRDPQGKAKLLRLLQREKPSAISVEISPYGRLFRARKGTALRAVLRENLKKICEEENLPWSEILSQGAIQGIFYLLKEPYEWAAARVYARSAGIPLKDIDLSPYSEEKLSHLPELISRENLRTLLRLPSSGLTEQVEDNYRRARFLFSHPPSHWAQCSQEKERENSMAEEIRLLVDAARGGKVMHIGGWEHLLEVAGGTTLFELLRDLHPKRVLL